MKVKFLVCAFSLLFALPLFVHAEEVEIKLSVVLEMESIGGVGPMDNSEKETVPPRPNGFRVSISGNRLNVSIQDESVSSALVRVIQQSTNTTVVEQVIYDETTEYLSEAGLYSIEIETNGGSLVGQFNVQ